MKTEELARAVEWQRVKDSLNTIMISFVGNVCLDFSSFSLENEDYLHFRELRKEVNDFIKSFGEKSGID